MRAFIFWDELLSAPWQVTDCIAYERVEGYGDWERVVGLEGVTTLQTTIAGNIIEFAFEWELEGPLEIYPTKLRKITPGQLSVVDREEWEEGHEVEEVEDPLKDILGELWRDVVGLMNDTELMCEP